MRVRANQWNGAKEEKEWEKNRGEKKNMTRIVKCNAPVNYANCKWMHFAVEQPPEQNHSYWNIYAPHQYNVILLFRLSFSNAFNAHKLLFLLFFSYQKPNRIKCLAWNEHYSLYELLYRTLEPFIIRNVFYVILRSNTHTHKHSSVIYSCHLIFTPEYKCCSALCWTFQMKTFFFWVAPFAVHSVCVCVCLRARYGLRAIIIL